MSIKPYIDLGWHTVPLSGELERNKDGTKTIPSFERNWRDTYSTTFNKKETKLGGAITGKVSGIIAVDCDNELTWKLFKSLDKFNDFVFISKGKGIEAGTFIYKYTEELPQNFSIKEDGICLDFYSNNGFIYLATEHNKTKIPLEELPEIQEIPETVLSVLLRMYKSTKQIHTESNEQNNNLFTANFLAPLVNQFVSNKGEYMPGLFRIITPKNYRTNVQYVKSSHLHPNNIPEGDGSTYLSQVSAILGADMSITQDLYVEAMTYINDLFDSPMEQKRLEATIIDPMIKGKASIDGKVIWKYDSDWSQYRSIFSTKDQSTIEVVYDDGMRIYYVVDESRATYASFTRDTELYNHLQAITATGKAKKEIVHGVPLVTTVTYPHKSFGLIPGNDSTKRDFNDFKTTPALSVFYNPEDYAEKYKNPTIILKYFETLLPNEDMRKYLLSFLKSKLTDFKYSPVVLYFLGVPGSGKGTFVSILREIFGNVPSPTSKEFLDKYNSWILGAYFVELDEYGNTLSTMREKQEALGKLKALTGKRNVDIRVMRTDSYSYKHNVTFIMSSNRNPLMLDDNDRRIALFNTPNILSEQDWVQEFGGIDKVYDEIISTVNDFCYYLATEVEMLKPSEYVQPPLFESKFELIANSMPAADKIAYCFKNRRIDYLTELCLDYSCEEVANEIETGEVLISSLDDLYQEITNDKGTRRALIKAIKDNGNVTVKRSGTNSADFLVSGYKEKESPFPVDE